MKKRRNPSKELAEEIDMLSDMLDSIVDLLEEKGILTHEELDRRIRKRVEEKAGLTSYRELE